MNEIVIHVQGSAPEPYTLRFVNRGNGNISAYCTCPAGENGQYCKHRFRILHGSTEGVITGEESLVPGVAAWLPGSDIELKLRAMQAADDAVALAQAMLSSAKKDLARAMRD